MTFKKSTIILTLFMVIFAGGFVGLNWYAKQQKMMELNYEQILDTSSYSVGSFNYLSYDGNWAIKIRQDTIQRISTILWRECFDSVSVFVRNDTLFAVNRPLWYNTSNTHFSNNATATLEITLSPQQQRLTIHHPFNSTNPLSVESIQLDTLCINSEFRPTENNTKCLTILKSNIKNLMVDYKFIDRFDFSLKSDTIQNVTLKLKGSVSSGSGTEDIFENSLITNINLECYGVGDLNFGFASNTPGKITGKIDGAISLWYPTRKDISGLQVKGVSKAYAYKKWVYSNEPEIKKEAYLRITSKPVFLPVFLDSTNVGRTPERLMLQTGTHHLRIKSGPKTFDTTVPLKKGTNKGFDVDLR